MINVRKELSEAAMYELRLLVLLRIEVLKERGIEKPDVQRYMARLTHLVNEFGMEIDDFLEL